MTEEAVGGRVFFSSTGRSLVDEDEIVVLSVGVDIGSSTSHLVFSRIVLERLHPRPAGTTRDTLHHSRYVVTTRETFHQSDILLTPYASGETIDAEKLGAFIEKQYQDAKTDPDEIDTGALILTAVAVRRVGISTPRRGPSRASPAPAALRGPWAICPPARPARWSQCRPATIWKP